MSRWAFLLRGCEDSKTLTYGNTKLRVECRRGSRGGLGALLHACLFGDAAARVAIPYNIIDLRVLIVSPPISNASLEPICRVVVHVDPPARSYVWVWNQRGKTKGKTMRTAARLTVPVLVHRFLRSVQTVRHWPKRQERTATAKAPFAFKVPRLDLLEGPFRRVWAFRE